MVEKLEDKVSVMVVKEEKDYSLIEEVEYDGVKILYQKNIPYDDWRYIADKVIPLCLDYDYDFDEVYDFIILQEYTNIDTTAISYDEAPLLYEVIAMDINDAEAYFEVSHLYNKEYDKEVFREVLDEYFTHDVTEEAVKKLREDLDSLDQDKITDLLKLFIGTSVPAVE